jgi:type IV pilus assembly protein PilM
MQLSAKKTSTIVGLDVEAGSIAATEVSVNGATKVGKTGIATLAPGLSREGEVVDADALGNALKDLFAEHKLPKDVRVGIANQRVIVRTIRMPFLEKPQEIETAIRFQAQDHVAMPLEQAVLDWQVVGVISDGEGPKQMDVVVVAARRDMVLALSVALKSAGLRPVGIDVAAFGMIRALAGATSQSGPQISYEERLAQRNEGAIDEAQGPAYLLCNLGDVTNLAVARGRTCLFTRVASFGMEGISQRLAERRGLTLEHARQWVGHVGLERPVESIEGDPDTVVAARESLAEGAARLADELRTSLEFYGSQEGAVAVEGIVTCGPGTVIDGLGDRLQRDLGLGVQVARPPALGHLPDEDAARLTLSYGLALEE